VATICKDYTVSSKGIHLCVIFSWNDTGRAQEDLTCDCAIPLKHLFVLGISTGGPHFQAGDLKQRDSAINYH
jgi:hypothetical protein